MTVLDPAADGAADTRQRSSRNGRPRPQGLGYGPLDMWLALLAGDRVWADAGRRPTSGQYGAAGFMLVGLLMTLVVQWVAVVSDAPVVRSVQGEDLGRDQAQLVMLLISLVAAAALAIRPVRLIWGRPAGTARYYPSLVWRGACYAVLILTTLVVIPRLRYYAAFPLGLVGAADALPTLWALGVGITARGWIRRFVFSTLHYGVLGAMLAAGITRADSEFFSSVVMLYIALWVGVLVSCAVVVGIDRLSRYDARQLDVATAAIKATERRQRAHWLHDDVLSEVQLTRMRISHATDVETAAAELSELDHRLRLRQLDELIRDGTPHIYEVLQPHIRRAHSVGVVIERVPPLEVTEQRVTESSARLLHRVVSGLTSNALNAGASRMSIDLSELPGDRLSVVVSDDAGEFSLEAVPPGRGLATLRHELGPDSVSRRDTDDGTGSVVTVIVPIQPAQGRAEPTKEFP